MKSRIVVADTSPLIALAVMDLLVLLPNLFDAVFIPMAVVQECLADLTKPKADMIKQALDDGQLIEKALADHTYTNLLAQILDQGEAEAIALANELDAAVLIDERAGRNVAVREGIECIGSLYCLVSAKQAGLIDLAAPKIRKLQQHGYHLHDNLIQTVLNRCQEMIS